MDYDKMMAAHSIEVQEENGKLKSKIRELERENKLLYYAINELMVKCDIDYFRIEDKEFYKPKGIFTLSNLLDNKKADGNTKEDNSKRPGTSRGRDSKIKKRK